MYVAMAWGNRTFLYLLQHFFFLNFDFSLGMLRVKLIEVYIVSRLGCHHKDWPHRVTQLEV